MVNAILNGTLGSELNPASSHIKLATVFIFLASYAHSIPAVFAACKVVIALAYASLSITASAA